MVKRMEILLVCLLLQGCATNPREVVVATITPQDNWSIDTAQYMTYSEKLLGSALLIQPEVNWKSGLPDSPLEFRIFMDTGIDPPIEFSLDPTFTLLSVGEQIYKPSYIRRGCSLPEAALPDAIVVIRKSKTERHGTTCVFVYYAVPQPSDWSIIGLHINGLTRNGDKVAVPEVRFKTTMRYAARCDSPMGRTSFFCGYSSYYDRNPNQSP